MIFNSIQFFIFLIITFIIYYIVKDKYKYIILLLKGSIKISASKIYRIRGTYGSSRK